MKSRSMWTTLHPQSLSPENDTGLTGFYEERGHFQTCVMERVSQAMRI